MTDQPVTADQAAAPTGVAADLLRDADPEVVDALREQLGLGAAPATAPTVVSQAGPADGPDPFLRVAGTHEIDTVEKPSPVGEIRLNVPGPHGVEVYVCGNKPPAQALIDAIEIHKQAQNGHIDQVEVILIMRRFLEAVLLPGHKERYLARLAGYTRDDQGRTLDPIDLPDMMIHSTKLLEVYTGRPLDTPPSSGPGGAASVPTSTAGASPTA